MTHVKLLDVLDQAAALSFLSYTRKIPRNYFYPVEDADILITLLKNTPKNVQFLTRPRLLAKKSIAGIDLGRLSDFDISLLDSNSPFRVDTDISRCTLARKSDVRDLDLSGLYAYKADFSKTRMDPEQLFTLSGIKGMKIPSELSLGDISDKLIYIAPELNSISLSSQNLKGCDLSCTDYPLEKLFENNLFEDVIFPECNWKSIDFESNDPIKYSIIGCTFRNCDLRGIHGLSQYEVSEASFYKCRLPEGLKGVDHAGEYEKVSREESILR